MNALEPGPWRLLVKHFWDRFFDTESLSPQADPSAGVVQTLGLLAVPGAFFVIICQAVSLLQWDLVAVRYWFVSFSMIVMALLTVMEWDALLPDRRDYQILMTLPLRLSTVFRAKIVALAMFLGIFLLDLNFFAVLFWPGIDRNTDKLNIMLVHLTVVVAAGLFSAVTVAALHGVLLTILPARAYRRVSVAVQTLLITVLVMLLFLTPILSTFIQKLAAENSSLPYYFPPYWFIGLYERLRPAVVNDYLMDLGKLAVWGFVGALTIFVLTYLPAYRLHALKLLDVPAPDPTDPGRRRKFLSAILDRLLLASPVQRGVFEFMTDTITRSLKHRIFLATYGGFGAALAITHLRDGREGLLALSITLSFILITGLRAAFNFPSELRANWMFQVSESTAVHEHLSAMRKWIVVCAILPLYALLAIVEFAFFPWPAALFHLAFGITTSVLLMDIMFFGFRKVPFTCAHFPGKVNLAGVSVAYVLGLIYYSDGMAWLETSIGKVPLAAAIFFTFAIAARFLIEHWRIRYFGTSAVLDYEDAGDPAVRTLDIG